MVHIAGACSGGSSSGTAGVAVGASVFVYGASGRATAAATDTAESTCVRSSVNSAADVTNGNSEKAFVQIDLGQETLVRAVDLIVETSHTFSNVDLYVGNSGSRFYDALCFLDADLSTSKALILCRREAVEATEEAEIMLSTSALQRTSSSIHGNAAPNTQLGKGGIDIWRGWKSNINNGNQWQRLDLSRVELVYGVVTQKCDWHNNRYVRSFTVQTSENDNDDWIPVMGGKVFQGNRADILYKLKTRFNKPVSARYVQIRPVTWNYDICMQWEVLVSPGKVKGRYLTMYADTQISICEARVYAEQETSVRSAFCSPREVQPLCVPPALSVQPSESMKQIKWSEPESYLTSIVSVATSETEVNKMSVVCGRPRLQVKVDKGHWRTVRMLDDVAAEQNGNPNLVLNIRREAPLLVSDYSLLIHTAQLRHVACSSQPSDLMSPASRVQHFNWTHVIGGSASVPLSPSVPTASVASSTSETITTTVVLAVDVGGSVDKYILLVEFREEIWFKSYDPSDTQPSIEVVLYRNLVFNGNHVGEVTFHVFACKNGRGCSPPSQLTMSVPKALRSMKLEEIGNPGDGLKLTAETSPVDGAGGSAEANELQYQVLLGQPEVRFTFDDMDDPLRADSITNWGSTKNIGKNEGRFIGQKPTFFDRIPGDRAITLHSGSLQAIDLGGMEFGPPFTVGFWYRSEVQNSCTDIFWARGSAWWNYIRIYLYDDYMYMSLNNYRHEWDSLNQVRSRHKIPYMEWRFVVISASADQSHGNQQKNQIHVLEQDDPITTLDFFHLIKIGHQCSSGHQHLGNNKATVSKCAEACQLRSGCHYFIYDPSNVNSCYWEKTTSAICPEGWSIWAGDFYEMPSFFVSKKRDWGSRSRGGPPLRMQRNTKIGGKQHCSDVSMGKNSQGKGSFSLSEFFIYHRELTASEKYNEFTIGLGKGAVDLTDRVSSSVEKILAGVPTTHTGPVDAYARVCNAFGCSPKVAASLGAPSPPNRLSATVDSDGQVMLEFFPPVSTGGSLVNTLYYNYTSEAPSLCDIETEFWKNPAVMSGLYARFDPSAGIDADGIVPTSNTMIKSWHDVSGFNRKFIRNGDAEAEFIKSGINGLPSVRISQDASLHLAEKFSGDTHAVYVVGLRTSEYGRLVSSRDYNWLMGWHHNRIGVAHMEQWCPNNNNWHLNMLASGSSTRQRIMAVRGTGSDRGKFYRDGEWADNGDCRVKSRGPGRMQLGGFHAGKSENAAGDFGEILLFHPVPTDDVHDMITAYLAWKWKDEKIMSDTERALLVSGINLKPDSLTCILNLPGGGVKATAVSVFSDNAVTKDTQFSEAPQSTLLTRISDIMLTSCNRFGCSKPASVRVQPPAAPTISSLRVVTLLLWTITTTHNTDINSPLNDVATTVTQGESTGVLESIVTGSTTQFVIATAEGVTFVTTSPLTIAATRTTSELVLTADQLTNAVSSAAPKFGLRVVFQKPTQTGGADLSFYLLRLVQEIVSPTPFFVDRVYNSNNEVAHIVSVRNGIQSGQWLADTPDAALASLTVELVSCSVLNCTEVPATISTSAPDPPSSVVLRRDTSDPTSLTLVISDPIHDGGQVVSKYVVSWIAYVSCRQSCTTFDDMVAGNVIAGHGVSEETSPSISGTTTMSFQLAVKEWTITIAPICVSELKNVVVMQGVLTGTLKEDQGTTIVITVNSLPVEEAQGGIVTQGDSTGILKVLLTGDVTVIQITVIPGVNFGTDSDIVIGATTISASSITNVACSTTTEIVVVGAVGETFVASEDLTVGSTVITAAQITSVSAADDLLSTALRVNAIVKACNTIGCGLESSSWNADMNTTLSYSSPFNILEPFEGNVDMEISWDTTSLETLTSNEVASPLTTLFHLTVPYISLMSKTLRRATGWVFSASEPDYASDNIIISNDGIQKASETSMINAVVVYEVMGMETGTYSLHALSKCPDEKHNKWIVSLPGDKRLTWSMPTYGEIEEMQWDVFQGTTWEVQSPGQKIWVELQAEHTDCVIVSLQFGSSAPPYSRSRVWPPKIGTPVMQEYSVVPYAKSNTIYMNSTTGNACPSSRKMNDLCGIRSLIGSVQVDILATHCLLAVNVPNPAVIPTGADEYSALFGSSVAADYFDLASLAPDLVRTDGWFATKSGLTDQKKIEYGSRVLAMGWNNDPNFVDCVGGAKSGDAVRRWSASKGQSCPASNPKCYTVHGPYAKNTVGVQRTIKLSSHTQVKIKLRLWKSDSWDNEVFKIKVDGSVVYETVKLNNKETGGFTKVKFCAYEPTWNWGQLFTTSIEITVPHIKEDFVLELSSNLNEAYSNEYWAFDQFQVQSINSEGSVGNDFDLASSAKSVEIQDEMKAKCLAPSPKYKNIPVLGPPTQLTGMSTFPDMCNDPPNQCTLSPGTIQVKWNNPRSWGLDAVYETRLIEVEYSGYVEGIGLVTSDENSDSSGESDLADDTNSEDGEGMAGSAAPKWPNINGSCTLCFNHTGKFFFRQIHSTDVMLKNLYQSVEYTIRARAVTTVGGAGPWSDSKILTSYDGADAPLAITEQPILVTAQPERMKIRWLVPDWRGSPVTELIIERSAVGNCGLAVIEWEAMSERIPINPRDYVNMPLPHHIDVWVGNCFDEVGVVIDCKAPSCDELQEDQIGTRCIALKNVLQSNTEYIFRAKAVNFIGTASDYNKEFTKSLRSGVAQAFVEVSPTLGNDTLCSTNDPADPKQDKEVCQTIHNALLYNEFESVHLLLFEGRYDAHPKAGTAIMFKRFGMGLTGVGDTRSDAVLDCGQRSCIDIDSKQKSYAPVSLTKLTFTNASALDPTGDRGKGGESYKSAGSVIRLVGGQYSSFTGIIISDCVFELSVARIGGAIFADCSEHPMSLKFTNVLFQKNEAGGKIGGGALLVHNCSTEMEAVTFKGNRAPNGGGGAARFSLGNIRSTASLEVINNMAGGRDGGGAFRLNGTAFFLTGNDNLCVGNSATHVLGLGGACLYAEYATLNIYDWNISMNVAATQGGAIRCMGSKLNVRQSSFASNEAKRNGGGIAGMLCNSEFIETKFVGNSAGIHSEARIGIGFGGAVYLGPGSGTLIRSSQFVENIANAGGGAFSCTSCDGDVLLYNSTFRSNRARAGAAMALYQTHMKLLGLGWGITAKGEKISEINSTVDTLGERIQDDATFTAIFSSRLTMGDYLLVGQELLLTSFSTETSVAKASMVESGEVLLVNVTQILGNKVTMVILTEGSLPEDGTNGTATEIIVPSGAASRDQLHEQISVMKRDYTLHLVATSQMFEFNHANESGGGAVYWDSPDASDIPFVEPVFGSVRFFSNQASYGNNFASAGHTLQGNKFYRANNTLPFSPIVHLEDHYKQKVVNFDISQSITVFAKASEKMFGKTDSTLEANGFAYFPSVGMAAEPGLRNCSFIASSSRIQKFEIEVLMSDCNAGTFLRNQESELRLNTETRNGKKLIYDEALPCPDGEYCRWECVNCPAGKFTADLSEYTCKDCPEGYQQSQTGMTACERCPVGEYARDRGATGCDPAEIDASLPYQFNGLRFLADSSAYSNSIKVVWDNKIEIANRDDIDGIQVQVSLGNAAFFDAKVVAKINLEPTAQSAEFDLSSDLIEAECKVKLNGLFCLPIHLMKYYTQVRVFTNNGKVGQNAFPAETWTVASDCTDREYLDDFSCPFCNQKRDELERDVKNGNEIASQQLLTIPSSDQIDEALPPGERLLNPLMWTCTSCPDGGTCRGNILYNGIISLFGWWRVETGVRPEIFQRCLYPPACLGAPNLDLAGRYFEPECIGACKKKCNATKALVGENFDHGACDYKCGYETSCDKALYDKIDCGGNKWWGERDYSGLTGWPGDETTPEILVDFSSFLFHVQYGTVAIAVQPSCDSELAKIWNSTSSRNGVLPEPRVPTCTENQWKQDLGERAKFHSVQMMATPKYTDILPNPPKDLDLESMKDESGIFYTNPNHTMWSINATRYCVGYLWTTNTEDSSEEENLMEDLEIDENEYKVQTPESEAGTSTATNKGSWIVMPNVCPYFRNGKWEGEDDGRNLPFSGVRDYNQERDYGDWLVYDLELIHWWDNITRSRSVEIRGFVYSAITNIDAVASNKPSKTILVSSVSAKVLEVSFEAKTSTSKNGGGSYIQIKKSHKTICNMGYEDPTEVSQFSKCDRGRGLVCERCDTDNGYMQECVNPKGSRCRLCASCDAGYKRAGEARCKRCPNVTTNRIFLILGVFGMIFAGSLLIYMSIEAADAKDNVSDAMKKIVINYLQVTSLAAGFPLKWPEPVEQMFAAMSAVSSAGQHILSPDCELSWMEPAEAFYSKQVGFAALPIIIFFISKIMWTVIFPCVHELCRKKGAKGERIEEESPRPISYYVDRTILTDVVFFYFLYPTMVKQAISLFACDNIGGKWYLSADLQEVCFSGRHLWWMTSFGLSQVGAYVIGFPLVGWLVLVKNRYKLHKRTIRFRYGLLYAGYRRSTFWWEGVVALRKVTFVVIAGVFGSRMGPDLQCFVALFVLFWFFNFHLTAHPFEELTARHRVLHHIETWAIIVGWCTMWMGLIFYLGNEFGRIDRWMMTMFTIAIISMNSLYLLIVMTLFFKEYVTERLEAREEHAHQKLVHKLAAQLHAEAMYGAEESGRVGMVDAAASLLDFSAKSPKVKDRKRSKMKKLLTKKSMSITQMENMETMLHTQRAFDAIVVMQESSKKKHAELASEREYQKGRMARRLKQRALERKMGITAKQAQAGRKKAASALNQKKPSKFSSLMRTF